MAETSKSEQRPNWDNLYETAAAQQGHFTTIQAAEAGYYPQLLAKYLRNGRIVRIRRGIYRLVHFPPGDVEDLVVVWLWSDRAGVFSHETALVLHRLSDALPAAAHLTLPAAWTRRRLRVPAGVLLHFGDIDESDRTWAEAVPTTHAARTVVDCAEASVSPELVGQAVQEGMRRGLFTADMVRPALEYLRSFDVEPAS